MDEVIKVAITWMALGFGHVRVFDEGWYSVSPSRVWRAMLRMGGNRELLCQ